MRNDVKRRTSRLKQKKDWPRSLNVEVLVFLAFRTEAQRNIVAHVYFLHLLRQPFIAYLLV